MIEKLIGEYVNRMTLNDVKNFAKENSINLKNKEAELIFQYIKNDWHTLVYGNPRPILDEIKNKMDLDTYHKAEKLYIHFKEKYQNYLQ